MDFYKKVDEDVGGEETALTPKKRGRPPIERDEDKLRKVDFRKEKGKTWVQEGVTLLDGTVTDVFTRDGHSWWRDERGYIRALGKYETIEQLVEKIEDWEHLVLRKVKDGQEVIPDAEALAVGLDVNMTTIASWRRGDRGEAFKNVIETELNKIAAIKNQLAMKGAIPQLVWVTMMNNIHGYTQNNKTEITVNDRREVADTEDLIKRAKLLP